MNKLCFLCGNKIGLVRTLWDQHYCSAEHRQQARLSYAQALREEEDIELWAVAKSRKKPNRGPSAGQTASAFAFLTVAGLLGMAFLLPGPSGGHSTPAVSLAPGSKQGAFERATDFISELVRQKAPVTLHHDFRSGLADWTTLALRNSGSKLDDPHKIDDPHTLASAA
jgi:hypothetical protein